MSNKENRSKSPEPSHITTGDYVILMETNDQECESWYYFIRKEGNEDALKYLEDQINKVEWSMEDDLSIFDIDLEHTVSAKTAKEMSKVELNSYSFHRKFDGKLQKIDLGFKKKDKNKRMMEKAFDVLGYGQIEEYIDDEDVDAEDLVTDNDSESESESENNSSSESESESESESASDSESKERPKETPKERPKGIPPAVLNSDRPGWAKAKGKKKR